MSNRFDYKTRLPVNFIADRIKEVLPEHFVTEYPDLIKFLEAYYSYMEEDDVGFSYIIQGLYQVKDIDSTLASSLNNLFKEIGNNSQSSDFFADPKFIAKVFASFYRNKGSILSAEGFFRAFYNSTATITYPKNNMFIVNESKIGPDSLRYIQDDKRYQIHSILIKSGIPLSTWESLYKVFIHPAGWYLAGDLEIESKFVAVFGHAGDEHDGDYMPIAIPDSAAGNLILSGEAEISYSPLMEITGIVPDDGDSDLYAERINIDRNINTLAVDSATTLGFMGDQYNSLIAFQDPNSPTFDEDSDGTIVAIDFSNTYETMDQNWYDTYDSSTNTWQYLDSA